MFTFVVICYDICYVWTWRKTNALGGSQLRASLALVAVEVYWWWSFGRSLSSTYPIDVSSNHAERNFDSNEPWTEHFKSPFFCKILYQSRYNICRVQSRSSRRSSKLLSVKLFSMMMITLVMIITLKCQKSFSRKSFLLRHFSFPLSCPFREIKFPLFSRSLHKMKFVLQSLRLKLAK